MCALATARQSASASATVVRSCGGIGGKGPPVVVQLSRVLMNSLTSMDPSIILKGQPSTVGTNREHPDRERYLVQAGKLRARLGAGGRASALESPRGFRRQHVGRERAHLLLDLAHGGERRVPAR